MAFSIFLTFTAFAQLEVKEGSFKEVPGFVNINTEKMYDDNDKPYAVLKIKTENISSKERRELDFKGDAQTFFEIEYKDGEVWLYITYYATFIKIYHEELSSTEYYFPFDMKPKHGYEIVLVNKANYMASGFGMMEITTIPESATITMNGRILDQKTPYKNDMIAAGKYEIVLSKDRYKPVTIVFEIKADEKTKIPPIDLPLDVAEITLKTDDDTEVYIDGELKMKGTWRGELKSGNYEVTYKKRYHNDAVQVIVVEGGENQTYELKPAPICGKLTVITEPAGVNVMIDDVNYGVTPVTLDNVIIGNHVLTLTKGYCLPFQKEFALDEENEVVIDEKFVTKREVYVSTDESGDQLFLDGKYLGISPITSELEFGEHELVAVRETSIADIADLATLDENKFKKKSFAISWEDEPVVKLTFEHGAIKGVFSVSKTKKVKFSQGNLQYQASTNTWRFAEHQWDVIREGNDSISPSYSGWIDLFGYGTSGYKGMYPYMTSEKECDYFGEEIITTNDYQSAKKVEYNIQGTNYDWGVYNAISNGSGRMWRTLTGGEWEYALFYRETPSKVRFACARVSGADGVILLPDNWNNNTYRLKKTNNVDACFDSNIITSSEWNALENAGAVFLPVAGYRVGTKWKGKEEMQGKTEYTSKKVGGGFSQTTQYIYFVTGSYWSTDGYTYYYQDYENGKYHDTYNGRITHSSFYGNTVRLNDIRETMEFDKKLHAVESGLNSLRAGLSVRLVSDEN